MVFLIWALHFFDPEHTLTCFFSHQRMLILETQLLEHTHVTARAAAHFPMVPPPPPLRVMVARPAQVTQVTQAPITLTQHDTATAPCDTTHPMWRHRGMARPEPAPPPPWLGKLLYLFLFVQLKKTVLVGNAIILMYHTFSHNESKH